MDDATRMAVRAHTCTEAVFTLPPAGFHAQSASDALAERRSEVTARRQSHIPKS